MLAQQYLNSSNLSCMSHFSYRSPCPRNLINTCYEWV